MIQSMLKPGNVAVITGGASGIGLACAKRFAALGLTVCIADRGRQRLDQAAEQIAAAAREPPEVLAVEIDVRNRGEIERLEAVVAQRFGGTDLLMNNAAITGRGDSLGSQDYWQDLLATNLWGVIHGSQVFAPRMIARARAGLIINTGSKQGITTPPGNPAYNVAKAGVKVYTEALEHQLRNTPGCRIRAHLLVPGFVFTGLSTGYPGPKPAGAWTAEQVVEFMMAALERGDFYILCPDNEVDRALDETRILWAAGDLIENRPPLSRWHPQFESAFQAFLKGRTPAKE
jgi:NAD(P)-dependent dehydrogenase (short-subunit alcohol dehydrogenase family)